MVIFLAGVYELSSHYDFNRPTILIGGLLGLGLTYMYPEIFHYAYPLPVFFLIILSTFWGRREWAGRSAFLILFVLFFLLPSATSLIRLAELTIGNIIMIIWLLQLNDSFGLLFGKMLGKRHPFPKISPNKSLEGFLAGGVGIGIGIWLLHTYIPVLPSWDLSRDFALFAIFFVLGNAGDLLFSSLKRKLDIKDFGSILPGHGGVLDRFDNILFVSPTLFLLIRLGLIL